MVDRRTCLLLAAVLILSTRQIGAQGATPGEVKMSVSDSRATFISMVKGGQLVGFDEALGTVTFRPLKPEDTPHEPGPMEDEAMASVLRAATAESNELHGLKVSVECRAGCLTVNAGTSASVAQTAELIKLALQDSGMRQVSASLPKSLKMKAAA